MNIGLDIDNVITNFDAGLLSSVLIEDKNKRNLGIVNKKANYILHGMFDWSKEEIEQFCNENMEKIAKKLTIRQNCKKIIDKLILDGHKIILISHRVFPQYKDAYKTTIDWLSKHKVNYSKLVLSESADKTKECLQNKIDIMVDDRADQCKIMTDNGIRCVLMKTKFNKKDCKNFVYATSFNNLYEIINKVK